MMIAFDIIGYWCCCLQDLFLLENLLASDGTPLETHFDLQFSIAPVALGLTGILLAMWLYKKENDKT